MRKTRLVILPTKCLHQMGFLLLFLSCPVIGDWGRIRPETENAHIAIEKSRKGTCGLQSDPSRGLFNLSRENFSDQCLKDDFKPRLSTIFDTKVRESLIKLDRKGTANQQRKVKAKQTRISESRSQNADQQRRILYNLKQTETIQNRKLLNNRKVTQHGNNRMSVRSNNVGFRRLSLAKIQYLKNVGTRNDVLSRSARLHLNDPERVVEKNILKNSLSRSEVRNDKMLRNLNDKLRNRRNDQLSRLKLHIYNRRQNDRTVSERLEKRHLIQQEAFNRDANEESVRRDYRQPERQNIREEINKNLSRKTRFIEERNSRIESIKELSQRRKSSEERNSRLESIKDLSRRAGNSEAQSLMPIKSEAQKYPNSITRRLTVGKNNEIMKRRTDSNSRRLLLKRSVEENIDIKNDIRRIKGEETIKNQKNLNIRRSLPDISMLQIDRREFSYASSRNRNIYRRTKNIATPSTFVMFKTTSDNSIRTHEEDTKQNIISVDGITSKLKGEKMIKENLELQQLNEYLALKHDDEKSEDFMNSFSKWTTLNGYNMPRIKDWIGNCFIGAAAFYLTSRQVKAV